MRLYLCKIVARWVYKNTNARNDTTRSLNPRFYFVHAGIILQSCYKRAHHPMNTNTSHRMLLSFAVPRAPGSAGTRASVWQPTKPAWRTAGGALHRRLYAWCSNHLAKLLQKFIACPKTQHIASLHGMQLSFLQNIEATCEAMCCVFGHAMNFCNNFAR